MAVVKFAYVCDRCGKRQDEYGSCPECERCGRDICLKCLPKITKEADAEAVGDPPMWNGTRMLGICFDCLNAEEACSV